MCSGLILITGSNERYENRKEQDIIAIDQTTEDALDAEIKAADEKADRMKMMIENLKHKLASSRPGVNSIRTKDLDEEPLSTKKNYQSEHEHELHHTTASPVHIGKRNL